MMFLLAPLLIAAIIYYIAVDIRAQRKKWRDAGMWRANPPNGVPRADES